MVLLPLAFSAVDYVVLVFYLLAMLAIGFYFNRQQRTTQDFFLAGRSMSWFPVGVSIMATLLSALSYTGIPSESYSVGWKLLMEVAAVWLCVPVMLGLVLPLYHRLRVYSIYEYLELRYSPAARTLASVLFVLWRLCWLGGVLYAPCKMLVVAAGLEVPTPVLIVVLGLLTTAYTFLGGMKAVIWTDVIQAGVMIGGMVLVIGAVWSQLEGGSAQVNELAGQMGRSAVAEWSFDVSSRWAVWGALPHWLLALLSFYVADQITAQRFLTTRTLRDARRSFLANAVVFSILVPMLVYAGICMLAYYQQHPNEMKPRWVANVDPVTRASRLDERTGEPLIDWDEEVSAGTIDRLVDEKRLIDPNRKVPFDRSTRLMDLNSQVQIKRLGATNPLTRETIVHQRARDELLPWFIQRHLPWGLAGLVIAALLAASMSSMDSGLNSITTLLVVDFHRRLGWGRGWLARRRGKPVEALDDHDELLLARPLVVVIGLAATGFSLVVAQIDDIFRIMVEVINTFGGPLLGMILLGIFSRRTGTLGALVGLLAGLGVALTMTFCNLLDPEQTWWRINAVWNVTAAVVTTLIVGWLVGRVGIDRKGRDELSGLVLGIGTLGDVGPEEAEVVIDTSFDPPPKPRWRLR